MLWQELTKIALLGTTQAGVSDEFRQHVQQQGLRSDVSDEKLVLETAALLGQLRKAGFPLEKIESELAVDAPATETYISPRSARHLERILDGTYALALPEYFYFLRYYNKVLLPELLPDLLQACLENPEFWPQVAPAIGERGRWLLSQNPKWKTLLRRKLPATSASWQPDEAQAQQAQQYIYTLKHTLSSQPNAYYPTQDDRQKLRYAAYAIDAAKYDTIATGWQLSYQTSLLWQSELERLLRTVAFRRAMIEELKNG